MRVSVRACVSDRVSVELSAHRFQRGFDLVEGVSLLLEPLQILGHVVALGKRLLQFFLNRSLLCLQGAQLAVKSLSLGLAIRQ